MKFIYLFIILVVLSSTLHSQTDSLLWGKWTVVGAFDGNILHDYKTDSVLLLSTTSRHLSRSELRSYANTTKSIYQNNKYKFSKDGIFTHYLEDEVYFVSSYKIDDIQQLITAVRTDSLGKSTTEIFKYSTDGKYMNLLIMDKKEPPFINTTFPLIFKLQKVD